MNDHVLLVNERSCSTDRNKVSYRLSNNNLADLNIIKCVTLF